MARQYLLDKSWAGHAFLAPASSLTDATNNRRRYYTTSSRKFIDTSLGGHFVMNPFPQFTATADLKHKPIFASSYGVGRWWSEVLDDNQQVVHIRCGVPQFNEMTTFFGNFYNVYAGSMARTGRAPSIWFDVGKVAGTIGTLPFQPFILGGQILKFFTGMPRSKYYFLKPTMYPFWRAYSSYVNAIFVNLGLSPRFVTDQQRRFFDPLSVPDKTDMSQMARIFPDLVLPDGSGIDFFAVATKAQRYANRYHKSLDAALDTMTNDPAKRAEDFERLLTEGIENGIRGLKDPGASLAEYEEAYLAFGGKYDPSKPTAADTDSTEQGFISKFFEQAKAEARMGAEFISYRVNFTPSNSDSFNNSATQSSIQSEINNMSAKARMARFNLADGNLSGVIGTVVNAVADVAKGVLSAAQVEGFIAVAGNAFADIQKVYESSSADLNRTSFTIHLRSWAADDWVRLQNLFIPLGGWLAMGLPRATGRSSYDGPFLLEVINQGHTLIREGMIESISIERGVGDVGWAQGGKPLGIDINITIVDLSTIMSVPINPGISDTAGVFTLAANALGGAVGQGEAGITVANALTQSTYGEDNKWTDYMATLGSLPLDVLINGTRRWQLAMARTRAEFNQWKSPYRIASGLMSSMPGELIKAISNPTDRS
jgi:hypothetical protein